MELKVSFLGWNDDWSHLFNNILWNDEKVSYAAGFINQCNFNYWVSENSSRPLCRKYCVILRWQPGMVSQHPHLLNHAFEWHSECCMPQKFSRLWHIMPQWNTLQCFILCKIGYTFILQMMYAHGCMTILQGARLADMVFMNDLPPTQTTLWHFYVGVSQGNSLSQEATQPDITGRNYNQYPYQHYWIHVAVSSSKHDSSFKEVCWKCKRSHRILKCRAQNFKEDSYHLQFFIEVSSQVKFL
jgi:hypothetical protein